MAQGEREGEEGEGEYGSRNTGLYSKVGGKGKI